MCQRTNIVSLHLYDSFEVCTKSCMRCLHALVTTFRKACYRLSDMYYILFRYKIKA